MVEHFNFYVCNDVRDEDLSRPADLRESSPLPCPVCGLCGVVGRRRATSHQTVLLYRREQSPGLYGGPGAGGTVRVCGLYR